MDPTKTKDNRVHGRSGTNVAVEVHSVPGSGPPENNTINCQARDISMTGMCIYTPIQLPAGSSLMLNIELGDPGRQFNLLGKVIWSNLDQGSGQFKTGIHLIKLPDDTIAWQTAVIQKLIG